MAYTTIDKSSLHFNTKLYTGNGANNHAITGVGFAPDFTWIKARANTYDHMLFDSLRGTASLRENLRSNSTDASDNDASNMKTLDSDGFTLNLGGYVNNSVTFASWNWKANGAGSANTDGSITSTVSANTTSGFSIVTYTGNSTAGATIGHGLGVAPKFIIVKSSSDNYNWTVYYGDATDYLVLNAADATTDSNEVWNDTAPSSTVFTVGNRNSTNQNTATFVAYCFAEKTGFSKFGSYIGNGNANGTFVYTGFKPAFIILKTSTIASNDWVMFDNKRLGYNVSNDSLKPNSTSTEQTGLDIDLLSNGFKIRGTQNDFNGNGGTYIFMAFAEAPLVGSNNVPATAR